jgi:hypothetical protein
MGVPNWFSSALIALPIVIPAPVFLKFATRICFRIFQIKVEIMRLFHRQWERLWDFEKWSNLHDSENAPVWWFACNPGSNTGIFGHIPTGGAWSPSEFPLPQVCSPLHFLVQSDSRFQTFNVYCFNNSSKSPQCVSAVQGHRKGFDLSQTDHKTSTLCQEIWSPQSEIRLQDHSPMQSMWHFWSGGHSKATILFESYTQ